MNRNVLIGGVAAVVVLLGTAGYLIFAGRDQAPSGGEAAPVVEGPVSSNAVTVVTDYTTNLSQDGKRLTLGFPAMEVAARAGKTASTVFSATWNIKVPADERVVVATATLNGFMKSAGTPPAPKPTPEPAPAPTAAPAEPAAPAADGAAAPAAAPEGEAPAATPPAAPAPAATPKPPAGPVAGDGVARIVVTVGGESAVSEWHDLAGTGQDRKLSRAVSFIAHDRDMRAGGRIPVTVAVEVVGGTAEETLVRLKGIDLQLFTESAPLPAPAAPEAAPAPAAAEGAVTPAEPATAEPAAAPAAGGTTP